MNEFKFYFIFYSFEATVQDSVEDSGTYGQYLTNVIRFFFVKTFH